MGVIDLKFELLQTIQCKWVYGVSIQAESRVGDMDYINALSRNLLYLRVHNFVMNSPRRLCFSQACIPLSYAAQIPTTHNPDMVNVRALTWLSNLDQRVRKRSVYAFVSE